MVFATIKQQAMPSKEADPDTEDTLQLIEELIRKVSNHALFMGIAAGFATILASQDAMKIDPKFNKCKCN